MVRWCKILDKLGENFCTEILEKTACKRRIAALRLYNFVSVITEYTCSELSDPVVGRNTATADCSSLDVAVSLVHST